MEAQSLPNPCSFNVLTFIFIILLLISHHTQPVLASTATATASTTQAYTNFISAACNTTTYPPLCFKTLSRYAVVVQTNPWKLSNAALNVTLKAAKSTSKLVSKLAQHNGLTPRDVAAIKTCVENIKSSIDELKQSIQAMGTVGSSSDKLFQMDSVKTWMSAAITDETTCTDGFYGSIVSPSVKNMINKSISKFTRLTSIALALINNLTY
ncbi:Pectinesterase inhibitor 11 [Camellia lanceoleosa]|uniref:Pectinesterase inhibitor 11 n=1 Tax=Camellia lanceoleosa TaxID=1840588 RepID=A0ACC0IY14_9ERIC|nr:Pectinesterase inhibitor 11 [Camellia lanceoleosa]